MAAREDQPQPVVDDRAHPVGSVQGRVGVDRRQLLLDRDFTAEQLLLLGQHLAAPQPVDRPVPGGRRDPGAGVVRHAALRPRLERRDEGILDGLLGEVEVAEDPDQRRDGPALLLTEQAVDDGPGRIGRGQRGGSASSSGRDRRSAGRADRGRADRVVAHRARCELQDRPDLDRAVPGARDPGGDRDRRVEVGRVDQVEAAEGLLRLRERTVGREDVAVADPDGRRGRRRMECLAGLVLAARLDVAGERVVAPWSGRPRRPRAAARPALPCRSGAGNACGASSGKTGSLGRAPD